MEKSKKNISVSVVIPAYNCEATLEESVGSILGQPLILRKRKRYLKLQDGKVDLTPKSQIAKLRVPEAQLVFFRLCPRIKNIR
jgi:hypothetical protein